MDLERVIERFNDALKLQEAQTIKTINRALDESFSGILRRLEVAIKRGSVSGTAYEVAVARELGKLLPALAPGEVDRYEGEFQRLLREAAKLGGNYGSELLKAADPAGGLSTSFALPIEAAVAGARESRRYLERHGQEFAATGAEVVARGVLEGRSNADIARELRERLGVVKSRAETIARTESLRAYSTARDQRYRAAGVETIRWWATTDDQTCPLCRPRAGLLYRLGEVQTPLHPNCRCTATLWRDNIAELDPNYVAAVEQHRAQVLESDAAAVLNRPGVLGRV